MAAYALAQAQVEDRRVADRVGREHEHGVRELQVETRACRRGSFSARCSSSGSVPARRESMCGDARPSRIRRASRKPSSLVASPPTSAPVRSPARASPAAASASARSQETDAARRRRASAARHARADRCAPPALAPSVGTPPSAG